MQTLRKSEPRVPDRERIDFLTTEEAAEKAGIGVPHLRLLIKEGKIPGVEKRGGRLYVPANAHVPVERRKLPKEAKREIIDTIPSVVDQSTARETPTKATVRKIARKYGVSETTVRSYRREVLKEYDRQKAELLRAYQEREAAMKRMESERGLRSIGLSGEPLKIVPTDLEANAEGLSKLIPVSGYLDPFANKLFTSQEHLDQIHQRMMGRFPKHPEP